MPAKKTSKRVIAENRDSSIKFYISLLGVTVLVIVGVVLLGKSDQGEIDVNAAIISSNQTRKESNETGEPVEEVKTIPKRLRDLPNGGLVPSNTATEEKPKPAETPTEEESASTTEDGTEESTDDGEGTDETDSVLDEEEVSTEEVTEETESAPEEEAQPAE